MNDTAKEKVSENCKAIAAITAAAAGGFGQDGTGLGGFPDFATFLKENGGPWDSDGFFLKEALFVHLYKIACETWRLIEDSNYLPSEVVTEHEA
ncbi:MAG: hypothetical protein PHZ19_06575 [Candidatus Thermoplasmatota archaeon]|nr:hypothetical protein [Candidatus Thermoplasmatota archaeon]